MNTAPQQERKEMTRNEFRELMAKERMLNGKAFEDCTRMELFEMIMSLLKQLADKHRADKAKEDAKLKNRIKRWFAKLTELWKRFVAVVTNDDTITVHTKSKLAVLIQNAVNGKEQSVYLEDMLSALKSGSEKQAKVAMHNYNNWQKAKL